MSRRRNLTEDMTMPRRVVHRATRRSSLPIWLFVWLSWLTVRLEILVLTDSEQRAELMEQVPAMIGWIGSNGVQIGMAVTVIATAVATFRQRAQNERRTD